MKKALGKGLNALLPSSPPNDASLVVELDIVSVEPNPEQPRRNFDEDAINRLAESIASAGVIQPIIVTDEGSYYKIIAGERRWRAARIAGLTRIPAIVRRYGREQGVEVALIENLQRQDLNPIEEANGYERLITEYGYTHEKIARAVGKSRPAIANAIRILKLSDRIRALISRGDISAGHARALLAFGSDARREAVARKIVEQGLSVRQTEILAGNESEGAIEDEKEGGGYSEWRRYNSNRDEAGAYDASDAGGNSGEAAKAGYDGHDVRDTRAGHAGGRSSRAGSPGSANRTGNANRTDPDGMISARAAALSQIEDELRSHFNTHVTLSSPRGKAGKIIIEFYGDEGLQKLLDQFGLKNDY